MEYSTSSLSSSVVSELEGTLLKDPDPFSYFMLVAFEASGLIRFASLLILWPVIRLLDVLNMGDACLKLTIFVATVGVRESDIESVARAVLPKFCIDDVDMDGWRVFSGYERRLVFTKMPRIMVERFVKGHLRADEVVGSELVVNRFGFVTGFVNGDINSHISGRIAKRFVDDKPTLGLGRPSSTSSILNLCKILTVEILVDVILVVELYVLDFILHHVHHIHSRTTRSATGITKISITNEQLHPPFMMTPQEQQDNQILLPLPVIFHDGRLVKRPTPSTALLILLWMPLGIVLAFVRIIIGLIFPMSVMPYVSSIFGGKTIVKGKPPAPAHNGNGGVLFVCTHRTLMDPVILSTMLQRKIPAVTYSISRVSEILSPIPTVRLTRVRDVDAEKIKRELSKGDLVLCPEGTTCREPFLLRFSALFAELTDRIVPVAMNYRAGFFHATTARGWKGLDPIFFFMNPRPVYEVTFLNQLPVEATCSAGKSPHDVANYVQRILAATLGFECTNFTRKDKYRVLAGNDGTVSYTIKPCLH